MLAGVGLVLMLAGLFGVLTYSVEQRTREIGVRLALGASPRGIARAVIGRGLQWMTLGLAAELAKTVGLYGLARNHMWGLERLDPVMVAAVSVLVLLAGLFACWLPARRAMSLEPTTVLRTD
jgi:putative ABC transport system permease protein